MGSGCQKYLTSKVVVWFVDVVPFKIMCFFLDVCVGSVAAVLELGVVAASVHDSDPWFARSFIRCDKYK